MGKIIANAVMKTITRKSKSSSTPKSNPSIYCLTLIPSRDIDLNCNLETTNLPIRPLPSLQEADLFVQQQQMWLQEEQDRDEKETKNTVGARTSAPHACCNYAMNIQALVRNNTQGNTTLPFQIQTISLGPLALIGMEGEIFCEYQLSINRISPFQTSIVLGLANGCIGYVPTENEFPLGGYECTHSYRVYGRSSDLQPNAERTIISSTLSMLNNMKQNQIDNNLDQLSLSALQDMRKQQQSNSNFSLQHVQKKNTIIAETLDSNFALAHDSYNAMGISNDGNYLYYVLSSESRAGTNTGARLYRMNTSCEKETQIELLCDLTTAMKDPSNSVVQGKSHVPLIDCDALGIVFGTHVGFYSFVDGMETISVAKDLPSGLLPYPGGCVVSYIPNSGELLVHQRVLNGEGVLTMAVDVKRNRAYYLTWPTGKFGTTKLYCDVNERDTDMEENILLDYIGRGDGESVHPDTGNYRCVCRSMVVDPRSGHVYFSNAEGDILQYHSSHKTISIIYSKGLTRNYFGSYVASEPGSMAYHWRAVKWWKNSIVGVHGNSGYLFQIHVPYDDDDDDEEEDREPWFLEMLHRLTSIPSQRIGSNDQFSYGYLGFDIDGNGVVKYLTGAPIFRPGDTTGKYGLLHGEGKDTKKGEAKGLEHLHLVTYDLNKKIYCDHGMIVYGNRCGFPTYVNSIAVSKTGDWVYALGRVGEDVCSDDLTDLFRFEIK